MLRRSHAVVLAIFLSAALCACASAARLVWDANTEPHLRGYKIHYGSASGQYTETVDVGNVTEWPIPDEWPRDRGYYFAATAYAECVNQQGQPYTCESGYSNEAVYFAEATPPSPATDVRVAWREIGEPTMAASLISSENFNVEASSRTAINVTIPSDADAIVVFIAGLSASAQELLGDLSFSNENQNRFSLIVYGVGWTDYYQIGAWVMTAVSAYWPGTGAKSLYVRGYLGNCGEGFNIEVVYLKNVDQSFPIGNTQDAHEQTDWSSSLSSVEASDLCFIAGYGYQNIPDVDYAGQTKLAERSVYRLAGLAIAYAAGDGSMRITGTDMVPIAFVAKVAAAAAKAIPPSILSRQRDAFHHMMIR